MTKRAPSAPAALIGISALILAAGCNDRSSPTSKAIESSSRDVHAISYGVTEAATDGVREKTFSKVAGDLGTVSANAGAGEKGAAAVLIAQAQASLGDDATAEAAAAGRTAQNMITQIEAQASQWRMRSAVAAAADGFDPSKQLAEVAKGKAEKDAQIKAEEDHRAAVQGQLNDLKSKAKAKTDAAAAKEDQYAQQMQQAVKMSAIDAAPIVERANVIKREADALRLDGTKFEAQAQTVAPLIIEIEAVIAQLTNQKKDLQATEAALAQQAAASKAEASEARAGATAANVEIEKDVDALAKQFAEQIEPAMGKALGLYNKAAGAAKESSAQAPTSGKASQGDIQMSIADLHWLKSQGLRAYANLLETLSKAEPALPKRADYAEKAKTARDQSKQELEAAAGALDAAKSAFGGASGRMTPEGKERMQKLQDLLDKAMAVAKDDGQTASADLQALSGRGVATASAAAAEKPAEAPAAAPAAGGQSDPALAAAVDAFLNAGREGRFLDAAGMTYVPESAQAAGAQNKVLAGKLERIDKAFKSKYGKGLIDALLSNPMAAPFAGNITELRGVDPAKAKTLKAADLNIAMSGDIGTVSGGGLSKPLTFKKVDGKWLFYDKGLEDPAELAMGAALMGPLTKATDALAGEVEAGKYPDVNAAVMAFLMKMQAALTPGGG
jgi:hypothetical protein